MTLCLRCCTTVETSEHLKECSDIDASHFRQEQLQSFLLALEPLHTAPFLITTFEYKLSLALCIPYDPKYQLRDSIPRESKRTLISVICHQNLVGWEMSMKGHTSKYWLELQLGYPMAEATFQNWDTILVRLLLEIPFFMDNHGRIREKITGKGNCYHKITI